MLLNIDAFLIALGIVIFVASLLPWTRILARLLGRKPQVYDRIGYVMNQLRDKDPKALAVFNRVILVTDKANSLENEEEFKAFVNSKLTIRCLNCSSGCSARKKQRSSLNLFRKPRTRRLEVLMLYATPIYHTRPRF